jgi:hypothetical protein
VGRQYLYRFRRLCCNEVNCQCSDKLGCSNSEALKGQSVGLGQYRKRLRIIAQWRFRQSESIIFICLEYRKGYITFDYFNGAVFHAFKATATSNSRYSRSGMGNQHKHASDRSSSCIILCNNMLTICLSKVTTYSLTSVRMY